MVLSAHFCSIDLTVVLPKLLKSHSQTSLGDETSGLLLAPPIGNVTGRCLNIVDFITADCVTGRGRGVNVMKTCV